jgi:hypothetical protein
MNKEQRRVLALLLEHFLNQEVVEACYPPKVSEADRKVLRQQLHQLRSERDQSWNFVSH